MKTLERNKQTIFYKNYVGTSMVTDLNGFKTGEKTTIYGKQESARVNVSASKGEATTELFGTDLNYSRTIMSDYDLGIDENSILWINNNASAAHDYVVVSKAKSLNSVTYAIKEVDVS